MDIALRASYSLLTIYMILILLRWVGPWIGMDAEIGWLRATRRLTDPLIDGMRRILPPLGPVDLGPIAALFVVWVARSLASTGLMGLIAQAGG